MLTSKWLIVSTFPDKGGITKPDVADQYEQYEQVTRRIFNPMHLEVWKKSKVAPACKDVVTV